MNISIPLDFTLSVAWKIDGEGIGEEKPSRKLVAGMRSEKRGCSRFGVLSLITEFSLLLDTGVDARGDLRSVNTGVGVSIEAAVKLLAILKVSHHLYCVDKMILTGLLWFTRGVR